MKIIKEIKQGRYINQIIATNDNAYIIMHGEQDMMYPKGCACWSQHSTHETLDAAEQEFKRITD